MPTDTRTSRGWDERPIGAHRSTFSLICSVEQLAYTYDPPFDVEAMAVTELFLTTARELGSQLVVPTGHWRIRRETEPNSPVVGFHLSVEWNYAPPGPAPRDEPSAFLSYPS